MNFLLFRGVLSSRKYHGHITLEIHYIELGQFFINENFGNYLIFISLIN